MRQAIISDLHSNDHASFILNYLKQSLPKLKIDSIAVNGDVLGLDVCYSGSQVSKTDLLRKTAPLSWEKISRSADAYAKAGISGENLLEEMGLAVYEYIEERYSFLFDFLKQLSQLSRVYFNFGDYESSLHYKVVGELAFLTGMDPGLLKRSLFYTQYRNIFQSFASRLDVEKSIKYISWRTSLEKGMILAGIPGLSKSSVPVDSDSELQERMTLELLNTIKRYLSYSDKLVLYVHTDSRTGDYYSPGSASVREFVQQMKGRMRQKVLVQGHMHASLSEHIRREDFNFVIGSSAIFGSMFNILEMGAKVRLYDVDPVKDTITEKTPLIIPG